MPSLPPLRIAQAALPVKDLDRARHFYGEVLGLTHLFDAPPALAFFQCGETRLMLSGSDDGRGGTILYYGVEDVEAAFELAVTRGAAEVEAPRIIAEVDGKPIQLAILEDADGHRLGLISG
jgi:methylmalonyl-CoA/ethylmalonyl-CoA epimerase